MREKELSAVIEASIAASSQFGTYVDSQGCLLRVPCISFLDYMRACLYDPEFGYYRSGQARVGKQGDFYTSSGIGTILAEVLVSYAHAYSKTLNEPINLIEWGAGTGRLSVQMAAAYRKDSMETGNFRPILIENHPTHREAARLAFAEMNLTDLDPIIGASDDAWEASWLREPALVVANELLDAFPVRRVARMNGRLIELGVAGDAESGFFEVQMPIQDHRIINWLVRDGIVLKEGQRTEIHADAAEFLTKLSHVLARSRLIIIDYGHEAAEYTAEHRMDGTLLCYWRHTVGDNPYIRAGEQDITSHVPFSFIRNEAEENGWKTKGYMTQKQFLLENGVLELLQNHHNPDPFSEEARKNRAIRQLLLSDQMSESFKVMILDKP
ncbi:SAM-dependent MidA family methyltransferase [Paenibacillus endophyticus]|uniref:SAM-dependent MidA family methyltransferase n=1 Tax=Paenibacillus endophyticus TaxID=1294268 RepID=A0A7W5C8A3_9BACL|nr:SAM-dependent methyltransferase [Paenibacillus endophyticus]MBB3152973.1 SAM-dependent MidA family methyltransferase [Paenibacillus endophyticus]